MNGPKCLVTHFTHWQYSCITKVEVLADTNRYVKALKATSSKGKVVNIKGTDQALSSSGVTSRTFDFNGGCMTGIFGKKWQDSDQFSGIVAIGFYYAPKGTHDWVKANPKRLNLTSASGSYEYTYGNDCININRLIKRSKWYIGGDNPNESVYQQRYKSGQATLKWEWPAKVTEVHIYVSKLYKRWNANLKDTKIYAGEQLCGKITSLWPADFTKGYFVKCPSNLKTVTSVKIQ